MKRDLCLKAAWCLLVSLLAVVMATERKTWPGLLAVVMETEEKTGQGPLPPFQNHQRQSSPKLGPEYEQRTTGSNSSVTAAGKGHIHVLSSNDQEKQVLKPSVSFSQDAKGQMPQDAPTEKKPSSITALPYDPDKDHGTGRLLVAVARTLVTSTASTTTVTVLSTCYNTVAGSTAACTGKRRRKRLRFITAIRHSDSSQRFITANTKTWLDSSIASEPVLFDDEPVERTGRLILWSSSITTIIFTSTSTSGGITVSASVTCIPVGIVTCG